MAQVYGAASIQGRHHGTKENQRSDPARGLDQGMGYAQAPGGRPRIVGRETKGGSLVKHLKLFLAVALVLISVPAFADTAASGGVIQLSAFGWLQPYVDSVVQALVVVFFGVIGKSKYSQWLDQSSRDALEAFVRNQASSLIARGAVSMKDKTVQVDNALLYRAATLAETMIPGALKHFGLTAEMVSAKIIGAIPQTAAGAAIVAAAQDPKAA
jgi:hypothetical protein